MVRGRRIGLAGPLQAGASGKSGHGIAGPLRASLCLACLLLPLMSLAGLPTGRLSGAASAMSMPGPPLPETPRDAQASEQKAEEEAVPRRAVPFMPARIADLWRPGWRRSHGDGGTRGEVEIFFEGPAPPPVARAGLWPQGRADRRGDFWFRPEPVRNMLFLGFDATRGARYASLGYKRALSGDLDRPGFRLLAAFGGKIRDHDPLAGATVSRLQAIRLLAGREWRWDETNIGLYLGPSLILHAPGAVQATRRAGRAGGAGLVDLWQNWSLGPTRFTALTLFADQAERSGYLRVRQGFGQESQPLRFGPEFSLSAGKTMVRHSIRTQDGWRKTRLGGFLGDIPLGPASLSLAAGREWRPHDRGGAYAEIGAALRY